MKSKKPSAQKLKLRVRKACVKLAKEIVKIQAKRRCEKCGADGRIKQMQGSHIFPEARYVAMSADTDNILCLCAGCHMWSADSWHESPLQAAEWFHSNYPERYETLKKRSQKSVTCDLIYWQRKMEELKETYNKLI